MLYLKPKPQKKTKDKNMNAYTYGDKSTQPVGKSNFTLFALTLASLTLAWPVKADSDGRAPVLPSPVCDSVNVPEGNDVSSRVYALGVQIYRWSGSNWVFVAPEATLYADACYGGPVGIHYAGPTWEANDGSKVKGAFVAGCTPYPGAIPWLRLQSTSNSGEGRFARVTFIQRVNTIGGTAPAAAGAFVGDEARVPYSTEYFFYRATNN